MAQNNELSKKNTTILSKNNDENKNDSLKFYKVNDIISFPYEEDFNLLDQKLKATTGASNNQLAVYLISQASNTAVGLDNIAKSDNTAAFMLALKPQNELEGALITQMVSSHNLSLEYMRRSLQSNDLPQITNINTKMAIQFSRLFIDQLSALQKLRGLTGNQKMEIKHVHVNQGAQAIVGNIKSTLPGGNKKSDG